VVFRKNIRQINERRRFLRGLYFGNKLIIAFHNVRFSYALNLWLPRMFMELVCCLWLVDIFVSCETLVVHNCLCDLVK
jgi:hypothetical protein